MIRRELTLTWNTKTGALTVSPAVTYVMREETVLLTVKTDRDLPETPALTVTLKLEKKPDDDPLVAIAGFARTAYATFQAEALFSSADINTALAVDGSSANDGTEATCVLQVRFEEEDESFAKSDTLVIQLKNDYSRPADQTPAAQPSPEDWLGDRAVRYDEAQSLSGGQQTQARSNIAALPVANPAATGALTVNSSALPQAGQLLLTADGLGALDFYTYAAGNVQIGFDCKRVAGNLIAAHTSGAMLQVGGGSLVLYRFSGVQVDDNIGGVLSAVVTVTLATGAVAFAGAVTAANLSGTNTGDQDLSSYATTSALNAAIAGLKYKASVRVATTANITLSGAQTIDGISVVAADRVLVKNQSTASQNGIYLCASGSWTRATDFDAWTEVPGSLVAVEVGTANADKVFLCTADQGGTLGSTSITFTEFGAGGGGGGGTAPNVGYVQSDGNDTTGTGTPSAPVATIQKAYDLGFRAFHLGNRTSGTHGTLSVGSGNVTLYFTGDGNCAVGAVTKPSSGMLTVISQPNIVFASFDSQPVSGASAGFDLRNVRVTDVVTTLAQNGADGATFGAAGANGPDAGVLVFVRCEIGGAVLQQAGSGGNGAAAETGSESAGGNGGYGGAAGGIVAEYTHFLGAIGQYAGAGGTGGNGDGAGNGGAGNNGGNVGTTTYTHCTQDSSVDIVAGTAGAPGSPDPMLPASDGLASGVLICCTQNYLSTMNVTTSVELYQGMAGAVTCESAVLINAYVSSVTASGSVSVIGAGIGGTFYINSYP